MHSLPLKINKNALLLYHVKDGTTFCEGGKASVGFQLVASISVSLHSGVIQKLHIEPKFRAFARIFCTQVKGFYRVMALFFFG